MSLTNGEHSPDSQTSISPGPYSLKSGTRPLLALVEGANDIQFLTRISRVLCTELVIPACLDTLVNAGRLLILPVGGGIAGDWSDRLAPLGCSQFHLYDGEVEPERSRRRSLVQKIVTPHCESRLTSKRSLENYLHPDAIREAGGGIIDVGDEECVATLLTKQRIGDWTNCTARTRQRVRYRAKQWLNTRAVDCMTASRLAERDPQAEVVEWLSTMIAMTA